MHVCHHQHYWPWTQLIGCGFLCMPIYCGKFSEVSYMSLHSNWFDIIPSGFDRLVDKGFVNTTMYYHYHNLVCACFCPLNDEGFKWCPTKGHITRARYVKSKSVPLKGVCTHHHWRFLETAWCVGHYGSNLQRPLRKPYNFDKLRGRYEDLDQDGWNWGSDILRILRLGLRVSLYFRD